MSESTRAMLLVFVAFLAGVLAAHMAPFGTWTTGGYRCAAAASLQCWDLPKAIADDCLRAWCGDLTQEELDSVADPIRVPQASQALAPRLRAEAEMLNDWADRIERKPLRDR